MQKLNATKKGLITGAAMIGLSLLFFYSGTPLNSSLQYLIYVIYTAGIVWAVYGFSKSDENTNKFAAFFLQAFKCFVVVTLLMVLFTFILNKLHPEFKAEAAKNYGDELVKTGNSTPTEIAANIEKMKQYYLTMLISASIFGYLLFGAAISAVVSLVFIKRK